MKEKLNQQQDISTYMNNLYISIMKPLYERQFIETMIRGTLGMLNDKQRMTDRESALQFIFDRTGATTEDEIRPIMRTMSCEDTMGINVGMGKFIKNFSFL